MIEPLDLGDRQLWPDGDITIDPSKLTDYIFSVASNRSIKQIKVTKLTPEVQSYNSIADYPIEVKTDCQVEDLFPPTWVLPDAYKYLNLDEYLIGLADRIEKDSLYDKRMERFAHEIWLFKELSLDDILRCLIYVVETMKNKRVVWGVGRGSSCSSYLLYVLGLHSVDAVKYDIDISDFIKLQGN